MRIQEFRLLIIVSLTVLGFFVSVIFTIIGGNTIMYIVLKPVLSGALMGCLGLGINWLLNIQFQNIIKNYFGTATENDSGKTMADVDNLPSYDAPEDTVADPEVTDEIPEDDNSHESTESMSKYNTNDTKSNPKMMWNEDVMEVEGTLLPKKPTVMADAVRHLMNTDSSVADENIDN